MSNLHLHLLESLRKIIEILATKVGASAEIRMCHFTNASQNSYSLSQLAVLSLFWSSN